jgi:signal peptidase I
LDFSLVLVLLTFGMGAIWALDAWVFRPRREAAFEAMREPGESPKEPALVDFSRSFFPIVLVVLLVRSFLYEPFRIPSSSMMPTLRVGDFIFVSKFSYGLRLPVLNTKILSLGEPQRGDVAVFRLPQDPSTNYIKRVVGVPGDTVALRDKRLWINGEPVPARVGRRDRRGRVRRFLVHRPARHNETIGRGEPHRLHQRAARSRQPVPRPAGAGGPVPGDGR